MPKTKEKAGIIPLELSIEVSGELAIESNADVYSAELQVALENINTQPATPEEFGQAELDIKSLKSVEEKIGSVREDVVKGTSETRDVLELLDSMAEAVRLPRLSLQKCVNAARESIRCDYIDKALATIPIDDFEFVARTYRGRLDQEAKGKRTEHTLQKAVTQETLAICHAIKRCRQLLDQHEKDHAAVTDRRAMEVMRPTDLEAELRRVVEVAAEREKTADAEKRANQAEESAMPKSDLEPKPESAPTADLSADEQVAQYITIARAALLKLKEARLQVNHPEAIERIDRFRAAINPAWKELTS